MRKRKVLSEKRKVLLKVEHRAYNKRMRAKYLHSNQLTFDIENDLVRIFEKYPKSLEKAISICFNLILDCFVVMYGEKKTIKLLE